MNNEPIFFKTLLLKGEAGGTIDRIEKTATVGTTDTYTIYLNDGSTTTFNVTNGSSIASIEYTSSSGNVDTYTVTLTDGNTTTFNVTNGEDYTVPTDGVIYFDGATIPDGYEETNPPSGSGQYAVIDDANASLQTTYSSTKINELISGVGGGGVNYSTTEQDTGLKWIDGKPIYQKTIDFGNLPNETTKMVSTGVSDIDALISMDGVVKWPSGYQATIHSNNTLEGLWVFALDLTGAILCRTYSDRSNLTAIVTIKYTKTTDTV